MTTTQLPAPNAVVRAMQGAIGGLLTAEEAREALAAAGLAELGDDGSAYRSAYRSREELAAGWSITPAVGHPEIDVSEES